MGDGNAARIAVDTTALNTAGVVVAARAGDVRSVAGPLRAALSRVAADLAGARSAPAVTALGRAAGALLAELEWELDELGSLLVTAASGYAEAEARATPTVGSGAAAGTVASARRGPS